jgi:diguanylate cyclase (GGDEF)-like protein
MLELVYFGLRLVLSGFAAAATATALRYAWRAYRHDGISLLPIGGTLILAAATALSTYDAIDNFVLRPSDPIILASWLWLLFVDLPMPVLAILLVWSREERDRLLSELSNLSVTDQLTGALNRHGFLDRAATSIAQGQRAGAPSSIVMLDIDHFKAINDGYGHGAGDDVLRGLAAMLSADRRGGDLLGRLGGEEFALFLFASNEQAAVAVAERLCAAVRRGVPHPGGSNQTVTVSGGVATVPTGYEPQIALSLALTAADEALYIAKRGGRDRIVAHRGTVAAEP